VTEHARARLSLWFGAPEATRQLSQIAYRVQNLEPAGDCHEISLCQAAGNG